MLVHGVRRRLQIDTDPARLRSINKLKYAKYAKYAEYDLMNVGPCTHPAPTEKWEVHKYYQYAKYEPCNILHIDFGVCILFCILLHIYAKQYAQYAK